MSARLDQLIRSKPRDRFLTVSLWTLALLAGASWCSGLLEVGELFTARRFENVKRFLSRDIVPEPLRDSEWQWSQLVSWIRGVLETRGLEAALATLSISIVAIVLAGAGSWLLAPLAARNLATHRPFESTSSEDRFGWRALRWMTRAVMLLARSIPEYIIAFLLLAILGPENAWPAILALALHNGGILGRLGAETIENLEPAPLRTLHALGARRRALAVVAVLPLALGRYLLFFFYRFETCIREATVLGMLGVVSLGYWIQDARAKLYYDEMLLLIGLGVLIVFVSDLLSALARGYLRRAS